MHFMLQSRRFRKHSSHNSLQTLVAELEGVFALWDSILVSPECACTVQPWVTPSYPKAAYNTDDSLMTVFLLLRNVRISSEQRTHN